MLCIKLSKENLLRAYRLLRKRFGFQHWWPAKTKDEMLIGAILTQNTSWRNVEKAIEGLRQKNMLSLKVIAGSSLASIQSSIRPSGFYRQKAKRLKQFSSYIVANYSSIGNFFKQSKEPRKELLGIGGIGNETADSMLLYAGNIPVFVIDAYTKRILGRVFGIGSEKMSYEEVQNLVMGLLPRDAGLFNDFHAQLVELAKRYCKKNPSCGECPLSNVCSYHAEKK